MAESEAESPPQAEEPSQAGTKANIEELQELKAREGTQAATEQAVRQLLSILDPHPQDHLLAYRDVLGRLENVIARELSHQQEG